MEKDSDILNRESLLALLHASGVPNDIAQDAVHSTLAKVSYDGAWFGSCPECNRTLSVFFSALASQPPHDRGRCKDHGDCKITWQFRRPQ